MGMSDSPCRSSCSRQELPTSPGRILAIAGTIRTRATYAPTSLIVDPIQTPSPNPQDGSQTRGKVPGEAALVRSAQRGDRDAFAALIRIHGGAVLASIECRLLDEHAAHDIAQDTWIKVAQGLATFRPDEPFQPWLFTIAMNATRDHLRGTGRRVDARAIGLESVALDDPPTDAGLQKIDESEAIFAALRSVAEPFRTALYLVDVAGLTYREAAESLDATEGTVKSRVHRGRRAFCEAYEQVTGSTPVHRLSTTKTGVTPSRIP